MENKLKALYNTMMTIETKGENTKTMAKCLVFIDELIAEENAKATEKVVEAAE